MKFHMTWAAKCYCRKINLEEEIMTEIRQKNKSFVYFVQKYCRIRYFFMSSVYQVDHNTISTGNSAVVIVVSTGLSIQTWQTSQHQYIPRTSNRMSTTDQNDFPKVVCKYGKTMNTGSQMYSQKGAFWYPIVN